MKAIRPASSGGVSPALPGRKSASARMAEISAAFDSVTSGRATGRLSGSVTVCGSAARRSAIRLA